MPKKVVILGAGITGLACAWKLAESGLDVEIIEKEPRLGGLASSVNVNGYTFDYGPHAFHTTDDGLLQTFLSIVGKENIITKKKWVKIKFQGKYYDYPLKAQDVFFRLNPFVALKCLFDFIFVSISIKLKKTKEISSKDWLINRYGKGIYNIFFAPYTEKVWGVSPDKLCASFIAYRAPTINLSGIIMSAVFRKKKKFVPRSVHDVPPELVWYYPKRGSIAFPESMLEKSGINKDKVHLNAIVNTLSVKDNGVRLVSFTKGNNKVDLTCDFLVSTIPLPELVSFLAPAPDEATREAADSLRFRSLVLGCLVINKERVFEQQTIYFTNRIFNRLAQMNSYSPYLFSPAKTGLIAEITCDKDDRIWNMPEERLLQLVKDDLEKEGFISENDVEEQFVLKAPYGYPILKIGYQDKLELLRQYFSKIDNLLTSGRQGSFNYIQMNFAFMSGLKMAEYIISGKTKKDIDSQTSNLRYYF